MIPHALASAPAAGTGSAAIKPGSTTAAAASSSSTTFTVEGARRLASDKAPNRGSDARLMNSVGTGSFADASRRAGGGETNISFVGFT